MAGTVGVPTSQANHAARVVTLAAARRMLLTGAPLSARRAFGASLEALQIRVWVGLCFGFCIGSCFGLHFGLGLFWRFESSVRVQVMVRGFPLAHPQCINTQHTMKADLMLSN